MGSHQSRIQPKTQWTDVCLIAQSCPTLCDPRTVASQAPLFMGFSRQEYWSGLPCPPPRDLPNPEIKPRCPTLQLDSLPSEPPGKTSLGRGTQAESSRGNPGELLCHVARSLGFYGDGVSFWVVSETDSGSLLVVHALFTQVGFQRGGFWEVGRTYGLVSPLSF